MRMGIDVGGTKIEAAGLDEQGRLHGRRRVDTPGDYRELLAVMARLVAEVEGQLGGVSSLGVCAPGARSPSTGRWKNAHHLPIQDTHFELDLEGALGRPVRLANDAHCFALSEATDGAGAGASVVFGAILGTGVGGGVVVDGRLLGGHNAIAGEWGHNPLPWPLEDEAPGPECCCGKRGCIEAYLSGPGLARAHREATGTALPAEQIAARAAQGDRNCAASLQRFAERLARALASVINLLDPDVIVLGGGVSQIEAIYRLVPERWRRWVLSDDVTTRLLPNRHGDSSGVRGAAWLWPA